MITLGKRGDLHAPAGSRSPSCARRTSCTSSSPTSRRASRTGRRLHAHREARPAPGRRGRDGLPRARGLSACRHRPGGDLDVLVAASGCSCSERSCWRSSSCPRPGGSLPWSPGGVLDITESVVLLKWSRRRKAPVGGAALIGRQARVVSPRRRSASPASCGRRAQLRPLRPGDEVEVTGAARPDARGQPTGAEPALTEAMITPPSVTGPKRG